MKTYLKNFESENPFAVEYKSYRENDGFYIELVKYENGSVTEKEKRYIGNDGIKCDNFLEALYKNSVTPVHLNCIVEDIF